MSELSESKLRSAFATRLQGLSPDREARLCAVDYRSRARRRRRVWAATGTGTTALTGGVVAAVLLLTSGASVAQGWTAVPNAPSASAVARATAACNWLNRGNRPPTLTGTPVLTDARGSYTAALYVSGNVVQTCISNGQHHGTGLSTNSRQLGFETVPGPDQLGDPSGDGGRAPGFPGSGQEMDVQGLAGSNVSAVAFEFADGNTVVATVQNGWYFAWWPGRAWPTSVKVTTTSKTATSPMSVSACRSQSSRCVFAPLKRLRRARTAHPGG